jgi:hypothetical protein
MFLKSPNCTHSGSVGLGKVKLTAIAEVAEVLSPGAGVTALTRTPIGSPGKTPNGRFIQIKFIKFVLTGQKPITITV